MDPILSYQANFNPDKVSCVESVVKSVATNWGLRVYEKDQKQMSLLTQGQDAFFIALYNKDNAILDISNVGMGIVLTMGVFDYGNFPLDKLHRLTNKVVERLSEKCDIRLSQSEKMTNST